LRFLHRRLPAGEVFFVSNPAAQAREAVVRFRVNGLAAEWWNPLTGERRALRCAVRTADGRTEIPLSLAGHESGFVVFRPRSAASREGAPGGTPGPARTLLELGGPWEVSFPPGHGAPASVVLTRLRSLSEHAEAGVRCFSGVATYRRQFDWTPLRRPAATILHLGEVQVMAEIILNGKNLGVIWCAPFQVDVSRALRPGRNDLEVRVANLWINRLIGDAPVPDATTRTRNGLARAWPEWLVRGEPPPAGRVSWAAYEPFPSDAPLPASGLLGPVRLLEERD
jgi:hypothetical protein